MDNLKQDPIEGALEKRAGKHIKLDLEVSDDGALKVNGIDVGTQGEEESSMESEVIANIEGAEKAKVDKQSADEYAADEEAFKSNVMNGEDPEAVKSRPARSLSEKVKLDLAKKA